MSQRERWIVYPLLFFCVMMSLQAQGCPPGAEDVAANSLTCEHLAILDAQGETAIELGSSARGAGFVRVYGFAKPSNRNPTKSTHLPGVLLSVDGSSGVVETRSRDGSALVRTTRAADGSGRVLLFDSKGSPRVVPAVDVAELRRMTTGNSPSDPSGEVPPVDESSAGKPEPSSDGGDPAEESETESSAETSEENQSSSPNEALENSSDKPNNSDEAPMSPSE